MNKLYRFRKYSKKYTNISIFGKKFIDKEIIQIIEKTIYVLQF